MFCKYCGKESETEVCEECKKSHTEETINVEATRVESNNSNSASSTSTQKSKIAAGLLGIFLGSLGIHNFYLGYTGKAVAQLLLTLIGWVACGMGPAAAAIWGLIEGILLLTGSIDKDADGNPLKD
ncbi:MAG: TM2 domain-containing protein [Clostridiaceae bacterium]|nr:TM2 domain-containing protein [Clostridiaceae bacterium]